jgi:hypothetical protein
MRIGAAPGGLRGSGRRRTSARDRLARRTGNGGPGSPGISVCGGVTLAFVGPTVGQVASAIGPTIIGAPVILAPITVSNGPVQAGP